MMNLTSQYILRGFERGNPLEIERINLMYYHPHVMEAKGYYQKEWRLVGNADLHEVDARSFNILSTISRRAADVSYAVADQANKLVGWIWLYQDKRHPLPKAIAKRHGLTARNSRIYQLSYEKLMSEGWPEVLLAKIKHTSHAELHLPRKGVIVAGLSLAIAKITQEYKTLYKHPRKLALYGYVEATNIASAKVLEKNGFAKECKQYKYDGVWHDLWVKVA